MGREVGGSFKREGTYVYLWLIHDDVQNNHNMQGNYPPTEKKKKKKNTFDEGLLPKYTKRKKKKKTLLKLNKEASNPIKK